jgi:hypothetical protein
MMGGLQLAPRTRDLFRDIVILICDTGIGNEERKRTLPDAYRESH